MRCSFFSRIRSAAKTAVRTAVVASAVAGTAHADIAINFQGDVYSDEFGRAVTQTAFGIAPAVWFEDPSHTAGSGEPDGSSGATIDGVTFGWTFNNDWAQSAAFNTTGATGEDEAYFGYLDDGGDGADITISGISAWLASEGATEYSVVLLMSTGQGGSPSLLDTPLLDSSGGTSLGSFSVTPEAAHSSGVGLQGFDTISGLTSDTLFVDGQTRAGDARGSIAGVILQANPIPEPSSLAVLGLGGLVLLRRRR